MASVLKFTGTTRLSLDPRRVLEEALEEKFERVIVIGETEDGNTYIASSSPDGGEFVWDVERAKHRLMQIADEMESE